VYEGLDGVASYFSALWQAFPDTEMRCCTRYIEDGDDLAIEADRTGTNSGPLPTPQLGLIPEA
jgi:predicted SnoaL-like aldol condensation-catalyzing enzyme